ncbi:hypothetical protein [Methanobacterium petrolearium]|uniref:hypothetical protein n=1 Tax=Methanobacterium petrolearium TaxID=710190 RepID=UPI001FD78327|nr:hypothetical protein [Methanobacterium petrolearium]MBP1945004.1 starvation-inducible outer membrane lipoprotein [Methanobacterium petrolearium]BDZ70329.1 hypothetical protein GCM10025861_08460 [Methanobacterium petrolearium]
MNKSKISVVLGLFIIILILMTSGCTFNPGSLINQKSVKTDDIVQFTVNIDESNNNNSYHVTGLVENKVSQEYRFVNLTVIGYNNNKEIVTKTIIMLPQVPAHDYATYDVWLNSSTGEKIISVNMKFINGTKV